MPDEPSFTPVPLTSETYQSVTTAFLGLKTFFLSFCTSFRVVGAHDHILQLGSDYLRIRKTDPQAGVSCICVEVGTDPDVLQASMMSPEMFFPFDSSGIGEVRLSTSWDDARKIATIIVNQMMEATYHWTHYFSSNTSELSHQNFHRPGSEPNFKDTGTPYIKLGA